jgi:hypothetical protein
MAGSKAATSNSSDDDPEIWRARYWRFRRWQADTHGLSYGTDGAGYRKMQNRHLRSSTQGTGLFDRPSLTSQKRLKSPKAFSWRASTLSLRQTCIRRR